MKTVQATAPKLCICVLALAVGWSPAGAAAEPGACALVEIDRVGYATVQGLKDLDGVQWWLEFGDRLLLCGGEGITANVATARGRLISHSSFVQPSELLLAKGDLEGLIASERFLVRGRRHALLYRSGRDGVPRPRKAAAKHELLLRPVIANEVVLRQSENRPQHGTHVFSQRTADLVAEVDADRWFADLSALAGFNRYTYSDGIYEAEEWLVLAMQAMPGMVVTTPGFTMLDREVRNVVGTLTGSERPDEWIIVGGHYDSTSEIPYVAAPGAEDNASGCAGVLELARIFAAHPPPATMLFICYAGEEQGLHGSYDHVNDLLSSGDAGKVKAMVNMDMIGYTSDSDLDCLLETNPFSYYLNDVFADAAEVFTSLSIVTDLYAYGSDHVPYLEAGIPALLTIENDWNQYVHYHTTTDLPEQITLAMGREILKMNVAGVDALFDQVFVDGFEGGNGSRWSTIVQ